MSWRCAECGATVESRLAAANKHVRKCPGQDPVQLAELILERGDYLDAHAEVVARAYLQTVNT